MAAMRVVASVAVAVSLAGCGGFGDHADLVVAEDDPVAATDATPSLRVTYLGCNGYLLAADDAAVLVDPYFTRVGFCRVALGLPIGPDRARIDAAIRQLDRRALEKLRAILVTHGHFNHLMDVPVLADRFDVPVVGSETACLLARAAGVPPARTVSVTPGARRAWPGVMVRTLPARHDSLPLGGVPYEGAVDAVPEKPPKTADDWLLGRPLAFLIEMGGQRVYLDSGGMPGHPPPAGAAPVDLAIVGVAMEDSRDRLPAALRRLRPRYLLPSHQDDFFKPLSDGFHFSPLADMDAVRRRADAADASGCLVLLDYFRPWSMPPKAAANAPHDGSDGP